MYSKGDFTKNRNYVFENHLKKDLKKKLFENGWELRDVRTSFTIILRSFSKIFLNNSFLFLLKKRFQGFFLKTHFGPESAQQRRIFEFPHLVVYLPVMEIDNAFNFLESSLSKSLVVNSIFLLLMFWQNAITSH